MNCFIIVLKEQFECATLNDRAERWKREKKKKLPQAFRAALGNKRCSLSFDTT
jgi:hypothetical protein